MNAKQWYQRRYMGGKNSIRFIIRFLKFHTDMASFAPTKCSLSGHQQSLFAFLNHHQQPYRHLLSSRSANPHAIGASFSISSSLQVAGFQPLTATESNSRFRTSAVQRLEGFVTRTEGLRFAVVVARFNEVVTKLLLEGALDAFRKYSVKDEDIDVVWVPGSFEIPVVAERLGKSRKYNAVLCIGAVIRGDTTHYDAVANSAASGVLSAGLNSGVPCIFGVLTCDDMDQALNRAGGKAGNKGAEAALTAIEMASLFEHHLQ